ncbi:MAG: PepSY domain-containing protein [Alphaproteobacteria bacterium]|nr:PepSY domain-containing protein [Alphaproteobacteria bacterium]
MLRQLHSLPGLFAAVFVIILALSGAIMSIEPALDKLNAKSPTQMNVAQMAALAVKNHQGVELITQSANGTLVVQYFNDDGAGNDIFDPQTGQSLKPQQPSAIFGFFKLLHRTFYVGTTGRVVAGIAVAIMFLACFSGLFMLAKRLGGWRHLFASSKGKKIPRLHVDVSRLIIIGLFITSLTGTYMSLAKFEFIDDGKGGFLPFPEATLGTDPAPIDQLTALQNTPLTNLRELRFPFPDDPFDVFTIITADGQGYIDQASGEMLVYQANSLNRNIFEFFYMLHTGQGLWWLGILLGLSALGIPIMAVTGTIIWWRRQKSSTKITANTAADKAEIIILVGSETNVTWGFAQHLQQKLTAQKTKTHIAAMNSFKPKTYKTAQKIIFITSTYGDGTAPESASQFLQKLEKYTDIPKYKYAVLGFGDKQFNQYSKFANDIDAALHAKGWQSFLPLESINQQSSHAFEAWGHKLAEKLNLQLELNHIVSQPKIYELTLKTSQDYNHNNEFFTRILQFSMPENMPKFAAGDLVAIIPPNSHIARYYSLATSSTDGLLGICVSKKQGGLCSPYLHDLSVGDQLQAYIQPNENFKPNKPNKANTPIIMIGAGTGIAPFIGFIADNQTKRDMHLYWGGRHPQSDALYQKPLTEYLTSKHLSSFNIAHSRVENSQYVQQKLTQDVEKIRQLMAQNAQIIVCGGRAMADNVKQTLSEMGIDIEALKRNKRYIEDVY